MNVLCKLMAAFLSCHLTIFSCFIQENMPLIKSLSFHLTMEHLVSFKGSLDTLEKIKRVIEKKQKGVYLRLEDEDLDFINKGGDLANEVKELIGLYGKNIIKALPLYSKEGGIFEKGILPIANKDILKNCTNILKGASKLWGGEINCIYSPFALHYAAVNYSKQCLNFLRFLKKSNCCLFVGYNDIPEHIVRILFGKNCIIIKISRSNYDLSMIEEECLRNIFDDKYKIIVTSVGSFGKVLQNRLWKKLDNVFFFDCDSLIDSLCRRKKNILVDEKIFNAEQFLNLMSREIKVVCTAAILDRNYEGRKREYIKSINIISNFDYEPYIIEACKNGHTFLEDYSSNVFYSNVNNPRLKNKGVNEAKSLIEGFRHYNFDDNDMIIKLTGRYFFESDCFVKLVENNPDVDAFVKIYANLSGRLWAFSGCFALRGKYFKDMLSSLNLGRMENNLIAFEEELLDYIQKLENNGAKIMYVDNLNVASHVYCSGNNYNPNKLTHW